MGKIIYRFFHCDKNQKQFLSAKWKKISLEILKDAIIRKDITVPRRTYVFDKVIKDVVFEQATSFFFFSYIKVTLYNYYLLSSRFFNNTGGWLQNFGAISNAE